MILSHRWGKNFKWRSRALRQAVSGAGSGISIIRHGEMDVSMSIITTPFGWLLLQLYNITSSYGLAIILFGLLVKIVLLPFAMKSKRGMLQQTRLTPRTKELEKKYAGNKVKYNEEVQKLYREEKVNPMSGCIWSLIPFPILLALYAVVRQPLSTMMMLSKTQIASLAEKFALSTSGTYAQLGLAQKIHEEFAVAKEIVPIVKDIDFSFAGINLADTPNWKFFTQISGKSFGEIWPMLGLFLIPILSAVLAFLSSYIIQKMTNKDKPKDAEPQPGATTMKSMNIMMPLISLYIGFVMPGALGLYWCATSLFSIFQEIWLTKRYTKILDAQDAVRLEKERLLEAEIERKRAETERLKAENATVINPNTSKKKLQKNEKQIAAEKQLAWEAERQKQNPDYGQGTGESSAIGDRSYARGRAYRADRYMPSPYQTDVATPEEPEEILLNGVAVPTQTPSTFTDDHSSDEYDEQDYSDETEDDSDSEE